MGLPPFSGGADVGGREALPRSPLAPFDPGPPDRRPFRYRSRAQKRSRRALRLAPPRPRRRWHLAAGTSAPFGGRGRHRPRARRSGGDRLLRYRALTNPGTRRLSTPLSATALRRPAGSRDGRAPLGSTGGVRTITGGPRRASPVEAFPSQRPLRVGRAIAEFRLRASIQPGAAGSLRLPPDDLAGVMIGHPPYPVLADKKVAGCERAAFKLLLAQHQRRIAVEKNLLVIAGDARRGWV